MLSPPQREEGNQGMGYCSNLVPEKCNNSHLVSSPIPGFAHGALTVPSTSCCALQKPLRASPQPISARPWLQTEEGEKNPQLLPHPHLCQAIPSDHYPAEHL